MKKVKYEPSNKRANIGLLTVVLISNKQTLSVFYLLHYAY